MTRNCLQIKLKTCDFLRSLAIAFIITLWTTQAHAIQFPDYFPLDPVGYGVRTYEWTFGPSGQYTSEITGTETVPYICGEISGVKITNTMGVETAIVYNDGINVKFLGAESGVEKYYASTDPCLTCHPSVWSFSTLEDGIVIDQGVYYWVKSDLSAWEMENDQMILIDIQDVTVLHSTYKDAVIWWYLDTDKPFTPLNFYGKESDLGITLPTTSDTAGYSVTDVEIYVFEIGLIAEGGISASTGSLNDLSELKEIAPFQCLRPIPGDLNGDCYVDFDDFAIFAEHWMECANPFDPNCQP